MSQPTERRIGDLRVVIDRDLCVGFGDCVDVAPSAFTLDADSVAVFTSEADRTHRDILVEACRACPVDALTAFDGDEQVAP